MALTGLEYSIKSLKYIAFAAVLSAGVHSYAQTETVGACTQSDDYTCIMQSIKALAPDIEKQSWRDQTYRELAKSYAAQKKYEQAVALIAQIETPDTKAMTIRGIGMEAAKHNLNQDSYDDLFKSLRDRAEKIEHPPSYAIALTYIAMAQAFAGDNDGAWATAADMDNEALRNKAYAETAEIQAEKGDYQAAMKSIGFVASVSFKNKAYDLVSKILLENGQGDEALGAAQKIENPYRQALALQRIIDAKNTTQR